MQRGNTLIKILVITAFFAVAIVMAGIKVKELFMVDFGVLQELQVEKVRLQKLQTELAAAKVERKIQNLDRNHAAWLAGGLMLAGGVSIAAVLFGGLSGWGTLRKHSIITEQIGTDCVLQLHYRDVRKPQFLALTGGLVEAQRLRAAYPIEGLEMSLKLMQSTLQAIGGKQGLIPALMSAMPNQHQLAALPSARADVPTFGALLTAGRLAQNNQILFGINDTGDAKTGTWEDLYSSAIAGLSGNGKSSTARSIILQSLLTGSVETFYIADPHRHKPEGLINTLGPVVQLPCIVYNETNLEVSDVIKHFASRMQQRVEGREPCDHPIVLVIDELLSVTKNVSGAAGVVKDIGTQGRGFGCYGLFLAQSWVGEDVGGTAARDNLTSIFCHRLRRKQAQTVLQDAHLSKIAPKLEPGQVIFEPTADTAQVLTVPYCSRQDAERVYTILQGNGAPIEVNESVNSLPLTTELTEAVNLTEQNDSWLVNHVLTCADSGVNSQAELAELTGVSSAFYSQVKSGKKKLSPDLRGKLMEFLGPQHTGQTQEHSSNVVKFPGKH